MGIGRAPGGPEGTRRRRGQEYRLDDHLGIDPTRQAWDAGPGGSEAVLAGVDLGTNNCRLLVARPRAEGFRIVDAFSRIVRLGEGVEATGSLSPAAMDRTIAALKVCAGKMRRRGVTHARSVATEACRRADNCADFLARVRAETGIEIEIISSAEEAALAFAGCSPLLTAEPARAVVFDIGGGSTEVGCFEIGTERRRSLAGWHSVPVGVVGLAERYGHGHGRVPPEAFEAMTEEMRGLLHPFEERHGLAASAREGQVQMLGTSGTVTTLCGVHLELPRYDRSRVDGGYLDFPTIERLSQRLAAMSLEERAAIPSIGRERADLVVAGCAILAAICRLWPVGRLRIADRGVREGILFGLLAEGLARRKTDRRWPNRYQAGL